VKCTLALLIGVAGAALAWAQADVSSGNLKGLVVDPAGGAIPGAQVSATDWPHGIRRDTATDAAGEYRLPLLPPGVYRVRVEAAGFTTKLADGVQVRVGDTVLLNVALEVGAVGTEITVTAEPPVIEAERTQQATTLDARSINNLPINRRDYLSFALLAPGVNETNTLVDANDFRVAQTPQSGLSFGGGNGRGNAFTVDGVEAYISSGGVRPTVGQEAVREFQVNRNSFNAEMGGGQGGSINIITKSGTNEVHGNVFGFLRNRAIQARNYFDPGKSAFTREQSGATLGAPLVHDKTFVFLSYERLDRHETVFVPILQDRSVFGQLTAPQQELVDFFSKVAAFRPLAEGLAGALITNNYPATLALFNQNSGEFPFSEGDNLFSFRVDHQFSPNDTFFLRGNLTTSNNQNSQFGALIGYSRGRDIRDTDAGVMISNTKVLNPHWVSETRAMFDYHKIAVLAVDQNGPAIDIAGYGSFGRDIYLPSTDYERHYQVQQMFDYSAGAHAVKFGADFNPIRVNVQSDTFFGGRFLFGPQIPLSAIIDAATGNPNMSSQLAQLLQFVGHPELIPDLQSTLTSLQAFNLGLPILYQQGFGDPYYLPWFKNFAFFLQDSWKIRRNFTLNFGARYELEMEPPEINTDTNNIAPRLGFAWTPGSSGKTVIRGGAGLYYAQVNTQIAYIPASLNGIKIAQAAITPLGIPGLNNPLTGQPLTSFDVYQTLQAQGVIGQRAITRQDLEQFGLNPGPDSYGRVIFPITPDYVNPYSEQASLEIQRAFGTWSVSAGYEFNRGMRLPRGWDQNLYYTGRTSYNVPTYGFYDPAVLQNNLLLSTGSSFYHALILQVQKRFSRHLAVDAHYTFSKTIDDMTDFNEEYQPNDQINARAERALSSFNQKHRAVVMAMFESPWRAGRGQGWAHNLLGDFNVAPVLQASSGRPFNVLVGYDNVGDNHPDTHRPYGAGRNIGLGPSFFTADLRLSRRFPFGREGQRNVEFTAEGFNMLNRTNFKNVNNTVGNVSLQDLPQPLVGQRGNPTDPLSFTSAFDPRQFQFGLKVNF
jgi:Carboxypeptidase regulatory-like domain